MTKTQTELAVKPEHAVTTTADFSGFQQEKQQLTKDDLAIPFISVLQANSPQVKRSEGAYIEGAQEGFLYNNVTNQIIDPAKDGFVFVLCAYKRTFVEWRVREKGGGFVAEHPATTPLRNRTMRDEKNRDIIEGNGNQLNDTRAYYVMVKQDAGFVPAVISFTSTQIKKAKQLNMQLEMLRLRGADGRSYTPPPFASLVRGTTVPESNEKGSWMGWAFEHEGYFPSPTDPDFLACREFGKQVLEGEVSVDMSKSDASVSSDDEPYKPKVDVVNADPDDDVPF